MRFSRPLTTLAGSLVVAIGLGGCNSAPQWPQQPVAGDYGYAVDYLRWSIEQDMDAHAIVGLSIALVDGDKTVWAQGFGLADRERGIAADQHTLYRLGSVSKPVVATAAMALVRQGRLDLDAPVSDYLPDFKIGSRFGAVRAITPRLLLTHHSGLPMDRIAGMWSDQPHFFTDLAGELADEELAAEPGSVLAYSNLGYSLMGHVIQIAAGKPFERYLQELLFIPAGMDTAAFSAYPPGGERAALAYAADEDAARRQYPLRDVPAGGLNASVSDLARFMSTLVAGDGPVKPADSVAMWQVQNAGVPLDAELEVGLGWFRSRIPGAGLLVHHGGATPYHRAYLGMLPDSGLGVVVLSNTDRSIETVLKIGRKALELAWEAKNGRRLPVPESLQAGPMPANYRYGLDDFVGHFDTRFGFARVRREGEGLAVDLNGEKLSLRPLGDGRFSLSGKILGLIPAELEEVTLAVSQIEGRKLLLSREDDGRFQVIGEALRPITVPQVWKARLGEYRILKPEGMVRQWTENGKVRLRLQDGFLLVEAEGAEGIELAFALQPLSVDRALVRGIGSNRGQLIRVEQVAGGEQVLYSGLRLQKI